MIFAAENGSLPVVVVPKDSEAMSSTQRSEQSEGVAASYASSSSKSSADWQKYYDLLVKRRDTAVNPSNILQGLINPRM